VGGNIPMLAPGQRLDRYELLCPVGSGGMASVWIARLRGKRGFENLVAIKSVLPRHAEEPEFQVMALDEARIVAAIRHPNVATIVDVGERDGLLYLVFEFVDGAQLSSLRKAVAARGDKFPLGIALRIMADTCAGLHAAHELADEHDRPRGIVHRDVSPQNILVSASGGVKLIDFGVARAENRAAERTQAGVIKGKIHYMPPEQASGLPVDRRADIWGVGAVLYQLLSGRLPIDGETHVATIRMLIAGIRPAPLPDHVPEAVAALVSKALAAEPSARFCTAADMQRALEQALAALGEPVTSADVAAFVDRYSREARQAQRKSIASAASRVSALWRDTACGFGQVSRAPAPCSPEQGLGVGPPLSPSGVTRSFRSRAARAVGLLVTLLLAASAVAWSGADVGLPPFESEQGPSAMVGNEDLRAAFEPSASELAPYARQAEPVQQGEACVGMPQPRRDPQPPLRARNPRDVFSTRR
jgi:serine/threonine-protein kinase